MKASTGTPPTEQMVEALWDRTGGNPFFVAQLVTLLEGAQDGPETVLTEGLPSGVRDVIRHRVALLPDEAAPVLTLAAVMGREFELRALAATAGREDEEILPAVEAAVRPGLVVEAPEVVGRCRFVHALVTETLYEELSTMRRSRLHARVGEALEQIGVNDPVGLAHHFWPGSRPVRGRRPCGTPSPQPRTPRLAWPTRRPKSSCGGPWRCSTPCPRERSRRELEVQTSLWVLLAPLRGYADVEAARRAERARELCLELGETRHLPPVGAVGVPHDQSGVRPGGGLRPRVARRSRAGR